MLISKPRDFLKGEAQELCTGEAQPCPRESSAERAGREQHANQTRHFVNGTSTGTVWATGTLLWARRASPHSGFKLSLQHGSGERVLTRFWQPAPALGFRSQPCNSRPAAPIPAAPRPSVRDDSPRVGIVSTATITVFYPVKAISGHPSVKTIVLMPSLLTKKNTKPLHLQLIKERVLNAV